MIRPALNRSHERWANLHPLIRFFTLAVLLGAIGLLTVKPGYRLFKAWRLDRNLESAHKAVGENRMDEARDLSLTVLRAGDPSIDAFRILEKSTAALQDPRHSDIARALMAHPESSKEDRLGGFRTVASDVALGLVGQAWVSLSPELQDKPEFAVAFGQRLIEEKRFKEAAEVLVGVPEKLRDEALMRGLVRVLIGSGKKEGFNEAQRQISIGIAADQADLLSWVGLLETIPPLALQENLLGPVRKRLEAGDSGDPARMALMVARMDYAAQYTRRAELLKKTIAKWKDSAPFALARFLIDLGLHQLLLETFPEDGLDTHPEVRLPLLEAAERSGAWDRVPKLLDAPGNPMPKLEELAHRAVLAARTEDATALAVAWNAAMVEAGRSPTVNGFLTLYRITREAAMPAQAEAALVEAIRLRRGPLPLYADLKSLMTSLQRQERENLLLEISAIYLQFEPSNPILLTQYAYLACLNQLAEPATILTAIEPMAKAFPKEVPIQCVLAVIYLCAGQPAKAAETLDPLELDPAKMPPAYRMAVLLTRILNKRATADDPLIREFPWQSLLPSERRKFSELIRSAEPKK